MYVTVPYLPPEWFRAMDTGLILAAIMLLEVSQIRKKGLQQTYSVEAGKMASIIDHLGHLCGYTAGLGAAVILRTTDPKWKTAERSHWYIEYFRRKKKQQPAPETPQAG